MASGLADSFRAHGPWPAAALAKIEADELAEVLDQDPEHEILPLFETALRDLGAHVSGEAGALRAAGVASFGDLHRLTAFADNLVPHVLSVDGVLKLDPALAARIRAGELLEHDSPEVELRACALHAIELLAAATEPHLTAAESTWSSGTAASSPA